MDPITNLREQVKLANSLIRAADHGEEFPELDALRLAELVIALDEWRRAGGYDPYTAKLKVEPMYPEVKP